MIPASAYTETEEALILRIKVCFSRWLVTRQYYCRYRYPYATPHVSGETQNSARQKSTIILLVRIDSYNHLSSE